MFVHCSFNLDDEKMIGVRIPLLSRSILQEDEKERAADDRFVSSYRLVIPLSLSWTTYLSLFNQ